MSTAAFLEDQDFFRFFGIFRNVTLKAVPDVHMEDVWFQPVLNKNNKSGKISVIMKVSTQKEQKVNARFILRDREGVKLVEASTLLEKNNGEYAYIQVTYSMTGNEKVKEREYRPFREIRDGYPRYIISLDIFRDQQEGVHHINAIDLFLGKESI